MDAISFNYTITFKSPFIIASSVNDPSGLDMVSILSDGVPYVPSSSFSGKLKYYITNHCAENSSSYEKYRLCKGQEIGDESGKYCTQLATLCPVCRIFGSPGGQIRAGFDIQSARISEPYYSFYKNLTKQIPTEIYTKRTRNRIDPLLRRAMEDALFSAGLVDVPVPFHGRIKEIQHHTSYPDDIREFDLSLLIIGMRLLTELGGGVNRGYGQCTVEPMYDNWQSLVENHIEQWKQAKT